MTVGDWLGSHAVRFVVETPTAGPPGRPLPGLRPVPAPDLECALALAEAEGTMGSGLAALWDGEVLTLLSRRVDAGEPVTARSPAQLAAAFERARAAGAGALAVRLDFDLDSGPEPAGAELADPSLAPRLVGQRWRPGTSQSNGGAADPGTRLVDLVLAGRGVVRAGAVPALRDFAARTGLGVLNVFTAKGVFRWDSPHHLGTGCLQERDLALAGGAPDAVLVTVGLDADECPPAVFAAAGVDPARVLSLEPADLPAAAEVMRARRAVGEGGERPALYRDLAAVAGPLYAATDAPLNPAAAATDIATVLGERGSVWTEPGPAGLWIGRTFSTVHLGSVRVPATGREGLAIAGAILAGLTGEGVGVAVVDRPPRTGIPPALLDWATSLGISVVVEVWGERGVPRSSAEHRERLSAALAAPGVNVLELPIDYSAQAALTAAAGPVVAWGGRVAAEPVGARPSGALAE
ncbi:MAG: thiamine pyrophosphate-binding protein [Frankia sp.]|nr:thiamine pyrophosphate-binding protein [Frankia sp.]